MLILFDFAKRDLNSKDISPNSSIDPSNWLTPRVKHIDRWKPAGERLQKWAKDHLALKKSLSVSFFGHHLSISLQHLPTGHVQTKFQLPQNLTAYFFLATHHGTPRALDTCRRMLRISLERRLGMRGSHYPNQGCVAAAFQSKDTKISRTTLHSVPHIPKRNIFSGKTKFSTWCLKGYLSGKKNCTFAKCGHHALWDLDRS